MYFGQGVIMQVEATPLVPVSQEEASKQLWLDRGQSYLAHNQKIG